MFFNIYACLQRQNRGTRWFFSVVSVPQENKTPVSESFVEGCNLKMPCIGFDLNVWFVWWLADGEGICLVLPGAFDLKGRVGQVENNLS